MEIIYKMTTNKIKRSGYIEFLYMSLAVFVGKLLSIISIFFFRLRCYDISYSASLSRNVVFFQSTKNSIRIGKNVVVGSGVCLKAGFNGKIIIGDDVSIHEYSMIFAHKNLEIGRGTMVAPHSFITDFDHKFPRPGYKRALLKEESYVSVPTKIGKNVWIGTHSVVLKGVEIGDNVIIGAGSVVTKSIPGGCIAVGNPARVIKKL